MLPVMDIKASGSRVFLKCGARMQNGRRKKKINFQLAQNVALYLSYKTPNA